MKKVIAIVGIAAFVAVIAIKLKPPTPTTLTSTEEPVESTQNKLKISRIENDNYFIATEGVVVDFLFHPMDTFLPTNMLCQVRVRYL